MQKFDTTAPIAAVVTVPAGRVHFVAADRADATVEVLPVDAGKGRDVKAAEQVAVAYADGVLKIESAAKSSAFGSSGAVAVTVHLPAGSRVEGKAEAAELVTEGPLGEVAFEGAYKHITVDQAAGLRLKATDGDIEIGRLNGPAEIATARGDIRIAEAVAGTVVLRTQSGSISVTAAHGASASLDAETPNGRISNALKNDGTPGLEIKATTSNGDITARSL
ncbi:DUF4097 family beta strand repeat-containing protein [Actinomadura rupiterrae]|uniref:DUF4097 family beta strand repeat-containing protein n=1 Tax=Actinomadura rupiterrae TaxID=559627 RepID=UPI0020A3D4C8|nr:DUF4097 family beta strand repeat-containing protein [Actinomadura rupiterrae]MCP2340750.1 hypothetical protein [Actinomadura rupiterrae]